jgi:hypothetical protein
VRNGFTFTDGCGYISRELCDMIANKFDFTKCSTFQIRFAGAKGVLMLDPELEG